MTATPDAWQRCEERGYYWRVVFFVDGIRADQVLALYRQVRGGEVDTGLRRRWCRESRNDPGIVTFNCTLAGQPFSAPKSDAEVPFFVHQWERAHDQALAVH